MPGFLLGVSATLSDPTCERVLLYARTGGGPSVFARCDADAWAQDGAAGAALSAEELVSRIEDGLGTDWERAEFVLAGESVVYRAERGGIAMQRVSRVQQSQAGADEFRALTDALGIPRSKRKAKFRQAIQFARVVGRALPAGRRGTVRLLDLACGRSYLGLMLVHRLRAAGQGVSLHGVDADGVLVAKCREIAEAMGWQGCTFEAADLPNCTAEPDQYDVVLALHACDTLTDEAIRVAWQGRVPLVFVAPCCQHELRHLWRDHPLQWISRYGLLEQRAADVLTDGLRCLVLEALGYRVKVLRFAAQDVTPKNLLIQGEFTGRPDAGCAKAARGFLKLFRARPRIAAVLDAATTGAAPMPDRHRKDRP